MAFLTGPNAPIEVALMQLSRSNRAEPYGAFETPGSPIEQMLCQLCGLINRFMGIIESVVSRPQPQVEDDFMKGWGEPGGDIES